MGFLADGGVRHRPAHTEEGPIEQLDTTRRLLTAYADARTPLERTRVFAVAVRWAPSLDDDARRQLADDILARLDGHIDQLPDLPDADRLAAIGSVADARKLLGSVSPRTLRTVAHLLGQPAASTPVDDGAADDDAPAAAVDLPATAAAPAAPPAGRRPARRRVRPGGLLVAAARTIGRRALAAAVR